MPRYNVEHKGKWACFSSVSDGFITRFMPKEAYEAWRNLEYGEAVYEPAENCNRMSIHDAVFAARLNRCRDEWLLLLDDIGLEPDDIANLVCKCDVDYQDYEEEDAE